MFPLFSLVASLPLGSNDDNSQKPYPSPLPETLNTHSVDDSDMALFDLLRKLDRTSNKVAYRSAQEVPEEALFLVQGLPAERRLDGLHDSGRLVGFRIPTSL